MTYYCGCMALFSTRNNFLFPPLLTAAQLLFVSVEYSKAKCLTKQQQNLNREVLFITQLCLYCCDFTINVSELLATRLPASGVALIN